MDKQERRLELIADTEGTDRLANEHLAAVTPKDSSEQSFRCECGHETCQHHVVVSRSTYEQVREDPMTFLVWPGHEMPEAEDVVETGATYEIVRKHEDLRPIVERTDPRQTTDR
jgi:uncharacterized Zn finger protein